MPHQLTAVHASLVLRENTIANLLTEKKNVIPLVDIAANAPMEDALDLLLANDILTLPVYKPPTGASIKAGVPLAKEYIGFVGAYDLFALLALHVSHRRRHWSLQAHVQRLTGVALHRIRRMAAQPIVFRLMRRWRDWDWSTRLPGRCPRLSA